MGILFGRKEMGARHIPVRSRPKSLTDKSEHICYKCLTKACCNGWCSDFFRWLKEYQDSQGVVDEDMMINYVVKYSRNESWTIK